MSIPMRRRCLEGIEAIPALRQARPTSRVANPLELLRQCLPGIAAAAATEDEDGAFPASSLAALDEAGLLAAPLRRVLGGHGWGIEAAGAGPLAQALRLLGRASLPLGRLYEGHVNALRLVQRFGTPAQAATAARDAAAGHLFAFWNTRLRGSPRCRSGREPGFSAVKSCAPAPAMPPGPW